jgi:lysophospholipase L1-like esterase
MKNVFAAILVIAGIAFLAYIWSLRNAEPVPSPMDTTATTGYDYIPVGDSYTIGDGLAEDERWPNLLVAHLREDGTDIRLITNPAVSGWTTEMAIEGQLPTIQRERPDFVTVLIGANDAFRGGSPETFRSDLATLLDEIEQVVPENRILLITIPDYSRSPAVRGNYAGDDASGTVRAFNAVIQDEGRRRGLRVADIFPLSQQIATDEAMFVPDGLHPSALQVSLWEEIIRKEAMLLLK